MFHYSTHIRFLRDRKGRLEVLEHLHLANPTFNRYIGIDYSGAETTTSGLKGLRIYSADRLNDPSEVTPSLGLRRNWTRIMLPAFTSHSTVTPLLETVK